MQEQSSSALLQELLKKERHSSTSITISLVGSVKIVIKCIMFYEYVLYLQALETMLLTMLFLEWIFIFRMLQLKCDTSNLTYQLEALEPSL